MKSRTCIYRNHDASEASSSAVITAPLRFRPNARSILSGYSVANCWGTVHGTSRRDTPVDPHMPLGRPYRVVQQVLKATGWYEKGEGAHTLRRSLAVCLYQADLDSGYSGALQNVQTMLGHRSVQTTEGYLGSSLGKHRLDKRVQGQRLIKPAQAVTSDNVIEMRRDNG